MKTTTVKNYIWDKVTEAGQQEFETRISAALEKAGVNGEVECWNAFMERGSGWGHYYNCAEIKINGEMHILRVTTTDSEAWDEWNEPTSEQKRDLFEKVIDRYDFSEIIEEVED